MAHVDPQSLERQIASYRARAEEFRRRSAEFREAARRADQEAAIFEARIAGIEEAADLLGVSSQAASAPEIRRRTRKLSPQWQKMIQYVDMLGEFDYDDLEAAAIAADHSVGRDTLRSQMSLYRSAGLVVTNDDGSFRLTDAGRKAAGLDSEPRQQRLLEIEPPAGNPADGSKVGDWDVAPPPSPSGHSSSGSDT